MGFVLGTLMPSSILMCGEGKGMRCFGTAFQFLTPELYTCHLPPYDRNGEGRLSLAEKTEYHRALETDSDSKKSVCCPMGSLQGDCLSREEPQ